MTTSTTTAADTDVALEPGTVVTARPWKRGNRQAEEDAIFLGTSMGTLVLVWWPHLGAPTAGSSVQAMTRGELTNPRPLADLTPMWVRSAYRQVQLANRAGRFPWTPAGYAIEAAAREPKHEDGRPTRPATLPERRTAWLLDVQHDIADDTNPDRFQAAYHRVVTEGRQYGRSARWHRAVEFFEIEHEAGQDVEWIAVQGCIHLAHAND